MPKESINWSHDPNDRTMKASVHWGPTGEVQIGVVIDRKAISDYIADLDKQKSPDTEIRWFTDPMQRGEVQNGIKALRRARDAAYGADE
jgi:hypothetical protein